MTHPSSSNEVANVNFSNLIQTTNEVTSDFKNELLNEMNNQFNSEEQRIFVNSFYAYLNHHPTEDFVIDLDIVCKFIGFSRKDHIKRLLEKNFSEGTDYKNLLPPKGEQVKVNGGAVNRLAGSRGTANQRIDATWTTGQSLKIHHQPAFTGGTHVLKPYRVKIQKVV
jgi:hypothetical protein